MIIKSEVPNADLKTNAGFQSFVAHVRNVLTTVNPDILTRTSDTGQIDPTTVATPLTTSNLTTFKRAGFDIYRFNDSVKNIYFKLTYGAFGITGSMTSKMEFGLFVELGHSTDGAGNLQNTFFRSFLRKGSTNNNPSTQNADRGFHYTYCCVKDGYLSFHFDVGSKIMDGNNFPNDNLTTESHSLIFSRQENSSVFLFAVNAGTSEYDVSSGTQSLTNRVRDFQIFMVDFENGKYWQYVNQLPSWSSAVPGTTGVVGPNVGVKRIEVHGNRAVYRDKNLLLYWAQDFGYEQQETISIDGVSSNFLFLTPALRATYPQMNIAIRWE